MVFFNREKEEKRFLLLFYVLVITLSFPDSPYRSHLADDVFDENIPIDSMRARITNYRTRNARIPNVHDEWSTISMCQQHLHTIYDSHRSERSFLPNSLSEPSIVPSGQFSTVGIVLPIVCLQSESQ